MDAGDPGKLASREGVVYSDAFSKLIQNESDLTGALAYAIYKRQKTQMILKRGLSRDDPSVLNYHHDLEEDRVKTLRAYAEKKLNEYADTIIAKVTDQERNQARSDETLNVFLSGLGESSSAIIDAVKSGTSAWKSVIIGVVSSFVFGLALTAASVVQWTNPLNSFFGQKSDPPRPAISAPISPG